MGKFAGVTRFAGDLMCRIGDMLGGKTGKSPCPKDRADECSPSVGEWSNRTEPMSPGEEAAAEEVAVEKDKILTGLEDIASSGEALQQGIPDYLISAARQISMLKSRDMAARQDCQAKARIMEVVENLYAMGFRMPDAGSFSEKTTLPTISTLDYDASRLYRPMEEVYFKMVQMGDGTTKALLTNEQPAVPSSSFGYVVGLPSKDDPALRVVVTWAARSE